MNKTRRRFLMLFCMLPFTGVQTTARSRKIEAALGSDYVLLDGWVLKKSDVARLLQ